MFHIKPFSNNSVVTYKKTEKNEVQIHLVNGDEKKEIKAYVFPLGVVNAIKRVNKQP